MDPSRASRLGRSFEFEGLGILVTLVETLQRDRGLVNGRGHEPDFEGEMVVRMAEKVRKTIICLDLPCSLTNVKFSCVEKNNIAIQIEGKRVEPSISMAKDEDREIPIACMTASACCTASCSKAKEAKKDLRKGRDKLKHHCGVNSRWPTTSRVLSKGNALEDEVQQGIGGHLLNSISWSSS
ncbi:hypothetical protein C4D60_Mb11t20540 [Musa balbisiana]|uniref:Uncharacterized protein n=1 Tax=Musa balbisiana TaxID=52838 RepID=A0A4S8J771_MUSBA|nr:hypothetical protein C4D60_Mb11t20540 [Musa balbisiana]